MTLQANRRLSALTALVLLSSTAVASAQDTSLVGLWEARRWFGPDLRGELVIERVGQRWRASIAGRTAEIPVARDSVSFDFPAGGTFTGRLSRSGASIVGHWIQPRLFTTGRRSATPITMRACGAGCYSGTVKPVEDRFTFYLETKPRGDGKLGAFLRNPERNQGRFYRVDNIARRGDTVHLRNARDTTIVFGFLRDGTISIPLRGGATFDFRRVPSDGFTHFYPRGRPTGTYEYTAPRQRNDGWPVARARDVGISEERLADMVRTVVNSSVDSANAYRLHGVLIARRGTLVLEEYFFGEHGDKPHDTRSGSKTFLTVVMGAAMHAGMRVEPETPVFATMGLTSDTLDPRKRRMTMRHLLTMTSGLDCDDSGDYHPGNEDELTEQDTNPDWTQLILDLKMLREPGERAVYCSINPYLAGVVLERSTGRTFLDLAWRLVGAPLQMSPYHMQLSPLGTAYNGGGVHFLPRDYMKLAQLYANGGTWKGRRILSEAWVRESVEPRYQMGATPNYGYLWWTLEYTYQGRRIRAHFASGNGGQFSIFIPELDLVVAAFGGNYADRGVGFTSLTKLVPEQILPAIVR